MNENQISRTALFTAFFRAYHAMNDAPKIFDDFLANDLLTTEESNEMGQSLAGFLKAFNPERAASCPDQATALSEVIRGYTAASHILSRARYAEDKLEEAIRQGVSQYVIVGAGMDTFAFRHKESLGNLHVFEIDHPAMQAFKRQRLAELNWDQPEQLHFIPVDFTQENLVTALSRSPSYDPHALSFFCWLGVIGYLPLDAVCAVWHAIADIAPPGSCVVFDYNHSDVFIPDRTSKRLQMALQYLRLIGEPVITGFDPTVLPVDLARQGLRLNENLSPTDIEKRYFQGRTDNYHAYEHMHFAHAIVEK